MIELLEPYDPQGTRSLIFRRKEHNMDSSEAGEEGCHAAIPHNSNREGDSRLARSRTHGPGGEEFHALWSGGQLGPNAKSRHRETVENKALRAILVYWEPK